MGLFLFLNFHGRKLNSIIIGIDTEDIIYLEEQLYFTLQSTEICAGIFLTAVVLALVSFMSGICGQMLILLFHLSGFCAILYLWCYGSAVMVVIKLSGNGLE